MDDDPRGSRIFERSAIIIDMKVSILNEQIEKISAILSSNGVVVAYLFGSAIRGDMGPYSDIDIAVIFEKSSSVEAEFKSRMKLSSLISEAVGVSEIDVINLESARGPLIKYQAIFGGQVILDKNTDRRLAVQRKIVRDYEDTRNLRHIRHVILREELSLGTFGRSLTSKIIS